MRSYLAVAGGIDVAPVMGSCSTDLKAGMGGRPGVCCKMAVNYPGAVNRQLRCARGFRQLPWSHRVQALLEPEYREFNRALQQAFWRLSWQSSVQSNRMGYRLQGQVLRRKTRRELLWHGLLPGVVQMPYHGWPIVLMNDAQTTGGYACIACVIGADWCHLAQIPLGQVIYLCRACLPKRCRCANIKNVIWRK